MASNLEITKMGYELFKQGDISTFVKDVVDAACTWITPGPQDKMPWAGNFKGRQEITNFFARVAQNMDVMELEPREMIEQGETVVVIGTSSVRAKRSWRIALLARRSDSSGGGKTGRRAVDAALRMLRM
jgi:uncharacterized protein